MTEGFAVARADDAGHRYMDTRRHRYADASCYGQHAWLPLS